MVHINTKTFIDIHTTGKRLEFGSLRSYDKFLKENNAHVVSRKDLIKEPKSVNTNYEKLAEQAWKERAKLIKEAKERIAKQQYELRNRRS